MFPARAGRPCGRVLRGKERRAQAFLDNPEGRRDEMEANCEPRAARSREAAREINFDAGIHARESGSTNLLHLPRRARGLLRGGKPQLFLPLLSTVIRWPSRANVPNIGAGTRQCNRISASATRTRAMRSTKQHSQYIHLIEYVAEQHASGRKHVYNTPSESLEDAVFVVPDAHAAAFGRMRMRCYD